MKSSVTNLIETLIILSDDEQPKVEKVAKESVDKLHNIFDGKNKKSLIELLEESFYIILSRIPRFIRISSNIFIIKKLYSFQLLYFYYFVLDCIKQKTELSLLSGYIKLFGKNHFSQVLNSHAHLDRLTTVIIEILELDYKNISLLEESCVRGSKI